jgi:hypothetical protein
MGPQRVHQTRRMAARLTEHGEWWCDSSSKQGGDKATEMGSRGGVSGDGGVLRWSPMTEEGS